MTPFMKLRGETPFVALSTSFSIFFFFLCSTLLPCRPGIVTSHPARCTSPLPGVKRKLLSNIFSIYFITDARLCGNFLRELRHGSDAAVGIPASRHSARSPPQEGL